MTQCKERKLINDQYVPCSNEVEDEIRAWGQIINPVRCKEHRARNRYNSRAQQDARRSIEISKHYGNNHDQNCDYARRNVPCVAFDW